MRFEFISVNNYKQAVSAIRRHVNCVYNSSPLPDSDIGVDNTPLPNLLVPEACIRISVRSEQDEDTSSSLCSQLLFTHDAAGTVADAQAIPVVDSVYIMVYNEAEPSMPSEILNGSYKIISIVYILDA